MRDPVKYSSISRKQVAIFFFFLDTKITVEWRKHFFTFGFVWDKMTKVPSEGQKEKNCLKHVPSSFIYYKRKNIRPKKILRK